MSNLGASRIDAVQAWESLHAADQPLITVGNATCGRSAGSAEVMELIQAEAAERGIRCNIIEVGCIGLCYMEPIVSVRKPGQPTVVFGNLTVKQVKNLVERYLVERPSLRAMLLLFDVRRGVIMHRISGRRVGRRFGRPLRTILRPAV